MKKNLGFISLMVSLIFCFSAITFAQETAGSVEVTVKDANGAVVPNASVTIVGTGSIGFKRTVSTDSNGFQRVIQVPAGTYSVTVAAISGFAEKKVENVQVVLGKTTQLDISVQAGSATAVVDVGSTDQPIDTTGNEISTSI